MPLLQQPVMQLSRFNGVPWPFAKAYFYKTGTTDPVEVFADSDLTVARTWPVVADDAGIFPAIYFDGNILIRLKLVADDGDLANPLLDIDPVNTLFEVYASNIADGAIEEKLGFTPVNPASATFTGNARLSFVPVELNVDDVGYRGTPQNIKNTDVTLGLDVSANMVTKDDGGSYVWTIPPDQFPVGHWMDIVLDNDAGTVTLTRGVGVSLVGADDSTNQDKVLPALYTGRLRQIASNRWQLDPNPSPPADLSANGYFKLPNGYIRQWGTYNGNLNGDATRAVAFPIPFPASCLGAQVTPIVNGASNTADMSAAIKAAPSLTGFDVYVTGPNGEVINGFVWEAWGR